jgi:hypothetical protein
VECDETTERDIDLKAVHLTSAAPNRDAPTDHAAVQQPKSVVRTGSQAIDDLKYELRHNHLDVAHVRVRLLGPTGLGSILLLDQADQPLAHGEEPAIGQWVRTAYQRGRLR